MLLTESGIAKTLINGSSYRDGLDYRKADLHLHSNFSYDVPDLPELSPRALYDKAVEAGMGYFTLTDHDTLLGIESLIRGLEEEFGDKPPIPAFTGIEMKIRDPQVGHTIHVNVLGLTRRDWGQLARRRASLGSFLAYCRDHGLHHTYNHPFWFEKGERATADTILRLVEQFPVIELNAGRIPRLNARTARLARQCGMQVLAASDSHTGRVGRAFTEAPGETWQEFLGNIQLGVSRAVPCHLSYREFIREIGETIDLVFLKQKAFQPKRTMLRETPIARRIARMVLGSERLMRPGRVKRKVRTAMHLVAYAPALMFILQQWGMHLRMHDVQATVPVLGPAEALDQTPWVSAFQA